MKFSARLAIATVLLAASIAATAIAQPAPPAGTPYPQPGYQQPGYQQPSYPPPGYQPPGPPPGPPQAAAPYPHPQPVPPRDDQFSADELIEAGHRFFGGVSRGLAMIVQKAGSQWGQPNGYVLGEEAGGAFVGGLRYGDGTLYTKNAGDRRVFWEGPTIGFDAGADGARTMMLVYNLPSTEAIFDRFGGIDGSAYFVGGLGMTALTANDIVLVPIRTGVGLRLGANLGYLKFTSRPTWNPF
ncbi:MAG TPA: DUF1134 domain-containing protein [Xanthobacteraceae bacterium]|nr:DUF1134 domain-containing protein [Xanthobacteraceae bacterium]